MIDNVPRDVRVQDPRAAKLPIFGEGLNSPAPQLRFFQPPKRPPLFRARLAERPASTLSRVEEGPGRPRAPGRVRPSSSACGKAPKARTPSSRAKPESLSPDKGGFPSPAACSERVKGSPPSAKVDGAKAKAGGGFPTCPSPGAVCGAMASRRERQKSHVRLKIASPCAPSALLLSLAADSPLLPRPESAPLCQSPVPHRAWER